MKTSKTSTALPFLADLEAVSIGLAEIAKPKLRPNPWALVMRRCPFYPADLRVPVLNYIARRVSEISMGKPPKKRRAQKPDPFAASKRLHSPSLRHLPYQQFLASEYWMAFRAEKIKQSGGCCSSCEATDKLQVHHLRYNNRGYECYRPSDTVVLCASCHAQRHKPA